MRSDGVRPAMELCGRSESLMEMEVVVPLEDVIENRLFRNCAFDRK
jgi:hypothetical protein